VRGLRKARKSTNYEKFGANYEGSGVNYERFGVNYELNGGTAVHAEIAVVRRNAMSAKLDFS
jgi:hypothetical protein